jgi:hypothetical protein
MEIARRYGVSADAIIAANNLTDPSLLYVGQVLVVPISTRSPEPEVQAEGTVPAPAGTAQASETEDETLPVAAAGDPSLTSPDLGIISPDAARWVLAPGLISTGGPGVRDIYLRGLAMGNNPHAFSKIGDCNSELPFFLGKFDSREYWDPAYLQPGRAFAGSFSRASLAWTGSHA